MITTKPVTLSRSRQILLIMLLMALTIPVYAEVTISGINEAQFVYRDAVDSLSNYFHNELNLTFNYRNVDVGMSFIADLPRYSHFEAVKDLHPRMVEYDWQRFYLAAEFSQMNLRVGSFNEFFGNGLILRSYRDKTFEWDTTLNGINANLRTDYLNVKALYGALPNEDNEQYSDTVAGFDLSSRYFDNLSLGTSLLTIEELRRGNYWNRLITGLRPGLMYENFDIAAEYAASTLKDPDEAEEIGQAIYAYGNKYFGKLTLSAEYKNYSDFDFRMNDLPTVNHSEEPLSERREPGFDEEGIMGQIHYMPTFTTSVGVSYSEAWNSGFDIRQSDLFIEGSKMFDTFVLAAEYGQLEGVDKDRNEWFQEITPAVTADFELLGRASHLRTQFQVVNNVKDEEETTNYFPLIQFDYFFNNFSFSMNAETRIQSFDDLTDNPEMWLGLEVTASLFRHTDIRAFIGEEKGGKVCRSGQCFYTAPFKGFKLDVTTRF